MSDVAPEPAEAPTEIPAEVLAVEPELATAPAPEAAAEAAQPEAPAEPVAVEPTPAQPVVAQAPSSASETQQPESAPEVVKEPLPLKDAVSVLLVYVKAHRTAGDADLEAAVADVEASLAAQA